MSKEAGGNCRRVMIVAGEASGDLHGGNLLCAAARVYPDLLFYGVGGDNMRSAGCDLLFSSDELSVMGIQEVFSSLPRILNRFKRLKKQLQGSRKPDLLVLIDFPDFNLRLAKVAKNNGVPVLYYISPKVWAWRRGRASTIADRVDRLALIFPFEKKIYQDLGVQADYVGNPLLDEFAFNQPKGYLREKLGFSESQSVVGVFPGSRTSEIKYIFDDLIETARLIYAEKPDVQFLLPVAPTLSTQQIRSQLADRGLPIHLVKDNIYEVADACDAALTVSGTVTLQLALTKTPMAIVYKVAPLSYLIGKRLIRVPHVGLTNIVAGRGVVREFLQEDAEPQKMCKEMIKLLDDRDYSTRMRADLAEVCQKMGVKGCSERVADIVAEMVNDTAENRRAVD